MSNKDVKKLRRGSNKEAAKGQATKITRGVHVTATPLINFVTLQMLSSRPVSGWHPRTPNDSDQSFGIDQRPRHLPDRVQLRFGMSETGLRTMRAGNLDDSEGEDMEKPKAFCKR